MAKQRVDLRIEAELVERFDVKAKEFGLTRTEMTERCWLALLEPAQSAEPHVARGVEQAQEGRKLDTYPAAPADPQGRRDWTRNRAAGWAAFGEPNWKRNAELIEQQRKAQNRA